MTTTIFRKDRKSACIACDSRVTWVDKDTNNAVRWFDSKEFRKSLVIDGVIYGFAGTNVLFKEFLRNYSTKEESEFLLDTVIDLARTHRAQFFMLRYDEQIGLKLFAYSPESESGPEIFKISKDECIPRNSYAIGSGKFSKEYKRNQATKCAQLPIRKIITANLLGLKKAGMLDLERQFATKNLDFEQSSQAFLACQKKGGDLFTGGDVNMSQNATKDKIMEQVAIMNHMDQQSRANGAVCASPINAVYEVQQLRSMGVTVVSDHTIEQSEKRRALYQKMEASLLISI